MFIFDGIIGIFLWPARLLTCLLGDIIGLILGLTGKGTTVTMEDILFNQVENKVPILNINFFEKVDAGSTGAGAVNAIRDNISVWYTALRNLSIVLIAIIVIYVGLRMALATVAADQAKYKTMLVDWLKSLALLFVLHIIILLVITVNDSLVKTLYQPLKNSQDDSLLQLSGLTSQLHDVGVAPLESFSIGAGCAIGYLILQILTFLFFVTYVKRMVHIAFLITIAPLVTITYSIDKMKDGRSQAFDTWFKQFWTTVLIQPFQCVAYLVLGTSAVKVMVPEGNQVFNPSASLATMIVGIVMLGFILSAENIVREIFGVRPNGIGRAAENMAMLTALSGVGKKAVSFGGNALKNSGAGKKVASKLNNLPPAKFLQNHARLREGLLTAGKTYVKTNTIATGLFTGTAQGGATERFGDEFLFALKGMENAHQLNQTYINAASDEHRLARAFNDYSYYDESKTAAEVAEECRKMLEGTITRDELKKALDEAKADKDKDRIKVTRSRLALFDRLQATADPSIKDKGKRNDAVLDIVKKIEKGEIGEYAGNSSARVIGAITPEALWGRAPKTAASSTSSSSASASATSGASASASATAAAAPAAPANPADSGASLPEPPTGVPLGRTFDDYTTTTGLAPDFESRMMSRMDDFKRMVEDYQDQIDDLERDIDHLTDEQRDELQRLHTMLDDTQHDIDIFNEPARQKQEYMELSAQIDDVMRQIEAGDTGLQATLDDLNSRRAGASANYDVAVERVRSLMDSNTGDGPVE